MDKNRQKLSCEISVIRPSRELYNNILLRVEKDRVRGAQIRLALFGVASFASFAALFPAFQYAGQAFYQSGSYEYLSLIFSEGTALLPYWKEFLFTIAESLPIIEIATVLVVVFILLESVKMAVRNTPKAFYLKMN